MEQSKWEELLGIMARLRGPEGCPWDREQTKESLKKYIIEEAYEVLEAIDKGDPSSIAEELGDLLLQVVFQAELAAEAGEFSMEDVLEKINKKLIRRHPHVFGETSVSGPREVIHNWEMIKKKEEGKRCLFDGIPPALPALLRAARVQQRAATVGFDWNNIEDVEAKQREEIEELMSAVSSDNKELMFRELGDVLFSSVNMARHLGIEAEDSLNAAIERFIRRYRKVERSLEKKGRSIEGATLEEMDSLWDAAKREENKSGSPS